MTTGNTNYNYQYPIFSNLPDGGPDDHQYIIGNLGNRAWSGGDAITPATPRATYRTGYTGPREGRKRGFKRLRVVLPPQNYQLEKLDTSNGAHSVYVNGSSSVFATVGAVDGDDYGIYDDPAKYYQCVAQLQAQLYGSNFSGAIFLAEGHEALKMIASSATRIRLALMALKRGNPLGVIRALGISAPSALWTKRVKKLGLRKAKAGFSQTSSLKGMSNLWVEANYGWLPLLQDVEAGATWLGFALNGGGPARIVKVEKRWESEGVLNLNNSQPSMCVFNRRKQKRRLKIQAEIYRVSEEYLPNLITPLSVAWEVLPWSFVVDWFVPVGSYLAALGTSRDVSGQFIITQSIEDDWFDPTTTIEGYTYGSCFLGVETRHQFRLYRNVLPYLPVPSPISDFLNKAQGYKSWRHAANAVALLSQLLL